MRTIACARVLIVAVVMSAVPAWAQPDARLDAIVQRLDLLEKQNAALRDEVQMLRRDMQRTQPSTDGSPSTAARLDALDEQVSLQAGRLSEQDTVKAQSAQRVPIRLTGTLLFSLFRNSPAGVLAGTDYPVAARTDSGRAAWAATLRRSVIGVEFHTPGALFGGQFHGSISTDLTEAGDALSNIQPRLRTAAVEGRWNGFAILAGQDKPIFSARDPTSLAQVQVGPLTGTGSFWLFRPQLRLEQTVPLGQRREFRARVGVSQSPETGGAIPAESRASVERYRPALEGHFQFAYQMGDERRFEIGSGFHRSTTHVLGTSVPADLVSLDWFVKPIHWAEFTGAVFTGENMSKGGSSGFAQGHALVTIRPGVFQPVPVPRHGGWTQLTFLPISRLTINLQTGVDHAYEDHLLATSLTKNRALIFNSFYRVAPNVLVGFELGQIRTDFKGGQHPRYNHHDIHVAYLF